MRISPIERCHLGHALQPQRNGLSLIEIIVVAGIYSTMLVMATAWIHQTMKQSKRFRLEHREKLVLTQLGQHFREHVWTSTKANSTSPNSISMSDSRGMTLAYTFSDDRIEFTQKAESGELKSMEPFVLPAESDVTFELTDDDRVVIKIKTLTGAQTGTTEYSNRVYRTNLVAKPTLGRWLKFPDSTDSDRSVDPDSPQEESSE